MSSEQTVHSYTVHFYVVSLHVRAEHFVSLVYFLIIIITDRRDKPSQVFALFISASDCPIKIIKSICLGIGLDAWNGGNTL